MDLMAALHDFHFLRPAWLAALPVLWGLAFWLARRRARAGNWVHVIDPDLLASLRLEAAGAGRTHGPWPLLALAWTGAVIALAGPAWERDPAPAFRTPGAWVVVLDLSPSMASTDVSPDRVTRARYAIDDLLSAARDARVALVVFGAEPYTVTPLTNDVATVRTLLQPLAPGILPVQGDELAPALKEAGRLLERTAARNAHVIVLTDGFEDPAAAFGAAHDLRSRGASVDVIGIGTRQGAPVRGTDGGFDENAQGRPVLARLDVDRLKRLASTGGGEYVGLDGLRRLAGDLRTRPDATDAAAAVSGVHVQTWHDAGAWLPPVVVLLAAALARRGWL